ncbi:glycosyltransferase family 9 protein [Occallatibacter savannae]|uniref:glycosyltransferase family 9 protein n=1 Tax=Occallatibacter savannae TaxID=1002691 RepID=UPI0013A54FDF|nr:glycosyltransferase family 9 protein [Occallatibacter savannae]
MPVDKILLVRRGGVGDLVMLTYLARALKAKFPQASVHLLTGKQAMGLATMCPYVDEVLPVPKAWGDWLKLVLRLRRERFDTAFIHHRFFAGPALAWLCGIPTRIGYYWKNHGFALTHGVPFQPSRPQIEEAFKLVELFGSPVEMRRSGLVIRDEDTAACTRMLEASKYDPARALIGLHVGGAEAVGNSDYAGAPVDAKSAKAFTPVRRWPAEHFAQLADMLIREQSAQVVIFRGPGDEPAIDATVKAMHEKLFLIAPLMPIPQFAALVSLCDLVVAGDSGPMHISVAVDTPTLAVFGPTHPGHSGPVGPQHRIAWSGTKCSPCWLSEQIAVTGQWNGGKMPVCWRETRECMTGLSPQAVYSIAAEQLSASRQASRRAKTQNYAGGN